MKKYKINDIVKAKVIGLEKYGVFVQLNEEYSGLIHISEISNKYVNNITDYIKINELIFVKILDIDETNKRAVLSIKDIRYKMKSNFKNRKISETKKGFSTLKHNLPAWIKEKIAEIEKK